MKKWLIAILTIGLILSLSMPAWAGMAPGLILYYRLEANATDSSGSSNDGTVDGATAVTGQVGQAYSFITNDSIVSDGTIGINTQEDRTLIFRVKAGKTDFSTEGYIWNFGSTGAQKNYAFVARGNPATWQISNGAAFNDTTVNITTEYEVIAITHNDSSNNSLVYKNGVLIKTQAYPTLNTGDGVDTVLNIGASFAPGNYFDGIIDEFLVYDRTLPEGEIRQVGMGFLHGGM